MRPADYAWPNIIRHDHEALNDVLSAGLTDIHAHLKASADTFELTWLDLMNRVVNRGEDFGRLSDIADARIHTALGTRYYPDRRSWCRSRPICVPTSFGRCNATSPKASCSRPSGCSTIRSDAKSGLAGLQGPHRHAGPPCESGPSPRCGSTTA